MAAAFKVIRWRLKEIMARYDITGIALAKELGVREASISNLRKSSTMPRIDGNRVDELCKALTKLANKKISFADLYEEMEED
ncbi:MAG TPA: helix-turn-helix transcriptional regulator [Coleofasciculaceae cyanobacterium]|jgi:DNA-binding Xre family transcriptional regulator